jgi:rfaE bifunctional protein nucleotidyltransferase chain/domain
LQEAKKQGDFLIVGLNSDSSVKEIKGESRPVQKENDRAEILLGLNAVDSVCIFSEDTPLKLIQSLMPDVLVKGGDWSVEDIIGHKEVLAAGGEVKSLSFIEGHSTTDLINSSQGLS